jgi:regulation of enolase protein 1 (concanavalin A-like superfamily)
MKLQRLAAAAVLVLVSTVADAQNVTAPWKGADIGTPTLSGSSTQTSGAFTIDAAGVDIWGSSDQFHFVYQPITGDVEIIARVDSLEAVDPWTNAGVMIRTSLAANAAHAYSAATGANGAYFRRRLGTAAATSSVAGPKVPAPVWVRLVRVGSLITGYGSTNGTSWTTISTATLPLNSTAYVGLAVSSHNAGSRATAVMSNVKVTRPTSGALPVGQQNRDIGSPTLAGSATYSGGAYTVKAAGTDIWSASDQFHFVHQPVTGDVTIVARVASLTRAHDWSKAGVMLRESLTGPSRHALVVTSAANGFAFQRRPETGGQSVHTAGGSGTAPGWVKLVRTGDLFEAFRSSDGAAWTRIGSDTIPMTGTLYAGLAVTSHNASSLTTAVIDNLKITPSTPTSNQPPVVSITSPANGATLSVPGSMTITATATDPENRMASVDFYAGTTLIRRDTTAPYSATWSPTSSGTYTLTATAQDAEGGSSTSAGVSVTVSGANRPPTAAVTVGAGPYTAPATIPLTATASDPEGQLARVEFFAGTTRLGTDTTSPYSFSWTGVAAGTYAVTAVAYDSAGASGSSASVTVTVGTASTGAPRAVVFTASTSHATGVSSYLLEIFAANANPATATPIATSDLGKPTPAANNDITVDRASFFSALGPASYVATVTAIGPGGRTRSTSVTFTR